MKVTGYTLPDGTINQVSPNNKTASMNLYKLIKEIENTELSNKDDAYDFQLHMLDEMKAIYEMLFELDETGNEEVRAILDKYEVVL